MSGCPSDEDLRRLIALPEGAAAKLEAHVESCGRCAARIEKLGAAGSFEAEYRGVGGAGHHTVEVDALIAGLKSGPSGAPGELPQWARDALGSYRIRGEVARGGMGIVLQAFDPELQREVAIKVLDPARACSPKARERFLREARAAAAIDHPNVLPIYAVDQSGELPYLVMPYVEGGSLASRLDAEGALGVEEAVRIALAAAGGLAAAHAAGLVHRDVKPANILLEGEGDRVWLSDFGLARAVEDSGATGDGLVAGTPQYMSPEQAEGREATERSDLYSLGSVLYHMLAGRAPYSGESPLSVLRQVADSSPEWPKQALLTTPAWLANLTRRLMAKRPEGRPDSAAEVVDELAASGGSKRRRRGLEFAAVAALIALVAGLLHLARSGDGGAGETMPGDASGRLALAGMIAQATEGAVIELPPGRHNTASWPSLTKAVSLRAADGGAVELYCDRLDRPVLSVQAAVSLHGVHLSQPLMVPGEGEFLPPLVSIGAGGEVELVDGKVTRVRPGKPLGRTDGEDGGPPPAIEIEAGGRLVLRRGELASASSLGILVRAGGQALVEDSVVASEFPVFLDGAGQVEVRRSALAGLSALTLRGSGARCSLDSNLLLTVGAVLWTRDPLDAVEVELRSAGNLYACRRGFAVSGWSGQQVVAPERVEIASLEGLAAFASEPEGASVALGSGGIARLLRDYDLSEFQPAPEQALERLWEAVGGLRLRHPGFGPAVPPGRE